MAANECGGSGLVAHTPHQVADGVLHSAPNGGVADCRLRGHSVLHREVRCAPRVDTAALLVGVGEGGEALGEVVCETDQGQCWSVVWSEEGCRITYVILVALCTALVQWTVGYVTDEVHQYINYGASDT